MAWEITDLEDILRELVEQIRVSEDGAWDWNGTSVPERAGIEKTLIPTGPMHRNHVPEICIGLDGCTNLELKDRQVSLRPGQFLVIPPGVVHRECGAKGEPCRSLWLNIWRTQGIRANVTVGDENGKVSLLLTKMVRVDPGVYCALTETISTELTGDQYGAAMLMKSRLVELMIAMIRQLERQDRGAFTNKWQETLVSETMEYLYRNGAEKTELHKVAQHLSISEKQLNRIFKQATGTTVINYFNRQRILLARYYLISTNLGMKEIADRLGYYDQYHFIRMFKKTAGLTPGQFRKLRREE